jgi:hypothetical protein
MMLRLFAGAAVLPVVALLLVGGVDSPAELRAQDAKKKADYFGIISAVAEDGKQITLETKKKGEDAKKVDIKITDKTKIEYTNITEEADKKLKVGYFAAVILEDGSKDTAAGLKVGMRKKKAG